MTSGINDAGQVVGLSLNKVGEPHAFLWTEAEGMQPLGTLPGGTFSSAEGINAAGQVVGLATTAEGHIARLPVDADHGCSGCTCSGHACADARSKLRRRAAWLRSPRPKATS